MRIIFFGTPSFAIPSLTGLLQSEHEITTVVTQPDKRKGRHRVLTPPPVKELASSKGIHILQPEKMRDPIFLEELSGINPDLIVVVAYGNYCLRKYSNFPPMAVLMFMPLFCRNTEGLRLYNGPSSREKKDRGNNHAHG